MTGCTERHLRELRGQAAGQGQNGMSEEGTT
jgi:hypothetical protein